MSQEYTRSLEDAGSTETRPELRHQYDSLAEKIGGMTKNARTTALSSIGASMLALGASFGVQGATVGTGLMSLGFFWGGFVIYCREAGMVDLARGEMRAIEAELGYLVETRIYEHANARSEDSRGRWFTRTGLRKKRLYFWLGLGYSITVGVCLASA